MKNIRRILMMKNKHIGDIILAIPTIHAIHQNYPEAKIDFIASPGTRCLLEGLPFINRVLETPKKDQSKLKRIMDELSMVKQIFTGGYDLFIDLTFGDRAMWYALYSHAKYRWAIQVTAGSFLKPYIYNGIGVAPEEKQHTIEHERAFLMEQGIPHYTPKLQFPETSKEELALTDWFQEVGLNSEKLILVHPTSRWLFKCWDDQKVADICDHLAESGYHILLTCGPSPKEQEKARHIASLAKHDFFQRIGDLSLRDLAALLRMSKALFGVDSAPAHLASAVNCPAVILFGPSLLDRWRPYGEKHITVQETCACIAAGNKINCDKTKTTECMNSISTDSVKRALDQALQNS